MDPPKPLHQKPDRQSFRDRDVEGARLDLVLLGCIDQLVGQNERVNHQATLPVQ
jgi:hypothetical protein